MITDKLSNGIPCVFFNFKGRYPLEAKIRKLLGPVISVDDTTEEATRKTVEIFKANNIEKVMWHYDGCACFWYIG